ncbi:MAG: HIT domain-containing protein [Candidatus Bipolaricaulota bacterium]|nr:HIT domain-containing protein [Candidatus Bipolaricaulota bacterium]
MAECSFCKIIAGELPSHKIYENENVLAFAPLQEHIIARGHMLIIPKTHYADIYDIPNAELHRLMGAIKIISQKLKEQYHADGVNILHASGKVAQQSILHFHIHLIPRYHNDGLDLWPNTGYREGNFPDVYREIARLF